MKNEALINRLKEVKVIFFDLDGTLIDTECLYFRFWKEAAKLYGYELSDEEALHLRSLDGKIGKEFFKEISGGFLDYDIVRNKRMELMNNYFLTHDIVVKDDVFPLLEKLNKEGKELYIVTANKVEKANKILIDTRLFPYFKGVISAKDVTNGKPAPDVYNYAKSKVNVDSKDIIVFEDSPNGVISASKANLDVVMLVDMSEPKNDEKEYINYLIHSFSEIL